MTAELPPLENKRKPQGDAFSGQLDAMPTKVAIILLIGATAAAAVILQNEEARSVIKDTWESLTTSTIKLCNGDIVSNSNPAAHQHNNTQPEEVRINTITTESGCVDVQIPLATSLHGRYTEPDGTPRNVQSTFPEHLEKGGYLDQSTIASLRRIQDGDLPIWVIQTGDGHKK